MVKQLFGLASVTALAGFVIAVAAAGCSGRVAGYADDASNDVRVVQPGDPGYPGYDSGKKLPPKYDANEPDPEGFCPSTDPITAADIDAQLNWQAPAAFTNVCTQQNINDLKTLFKTAPGGGGIKFADIKIALGATCASCAFSPMNGGTWQVFVEDGAGGAVDNRTGSCFAHRSGAACGKARFRWESCLESACSEAECGADRVQACTQKAQNGACKDLTSDYAKACPNETTDLVPCGNIFGSIATSCSGGPGNTIDITPP
jgi:hypothetical protein